MSALRNAADPPWHVALREFANDPSAVAGSLLLAAIITAALLAPVLAGRVDGLAGSHQARDVISATLYGLRTSLFVGAVATGGALASGVLIGLALGVAGGTIDALMTRIVDAVLSFPAVLLALLLVAVLGHGTRNVIVALIVVQSACYASMLRHAAIEEKDKPYIQAAHGLGLSRTRVVLRHLLPNCLSPIMTLALVQLGSAIALEATLSFVGLGLRESEPSLGVLIAHGFQRLLTGDYWISLFPAAALVATIASINLLADGFRGALIPTPAKLDRMRLRS